MRVWAAIRLDADAAFLNNDWFNYEKINKWREEASKSSPDFLVVRNRSESFQSYLGGGAITLDDVVQQLYDNGYHYKHISAFICRWDGQTNKAWNFHTQKEEVR
jgi:hypothetical protein